MTQDIFSLSYSAVHPGTDKTQVFFHDFDSEANPRDIFLPGRSGTGRCFVTDITVATLPFMQDFLRDFDIDDCNDIEVNRSYQVGSDTLVCLGAGEVFKTIDSVLKIVATALDAGLQRTGLFVGIGGGVICDMTAFAASIFKRGAQLELVPTTLLSMVDASVGGKTGCDFDSYKNMIGTFYPASKIHIFRAFIQSLPESEYNSGLAETLKTALLYAPKLFYILQNQYEEIENRDKDIVGQLIRRCIIAKANIVEKDLTETGLRMQLNFGHTFGHALETCAGLGKITHGAAIAWGMGRALELSVLLGHCEPEYRDEVQEVLTKYGWETKAYHPALDLAGISPQAAPEKLLAAMKKDKKNASSKIRCILQREINSTLIEEVPEDMLIKALLD